MPTYCYRCTRNDEHTKEMFFPIAERRNQIQCSCGAVMERDFAAEHSYSPKDGLWPLYSDAAGVSSNLIESERKRFPHHEFRKTEEGTYQRVFRSAAHRKACLKELGMFDKRAYI